jgi:peptide/nickel transport system substrate-binding protein
MPASLSPNRLILGLVSALALGSVSLPVLAQERPDLVVGVADLPPTLEPGKELSNVGTRVNYSIFDTLIRRDFLSAEGGGGSELVPGLATSWTRIDDLTLEIKLREGVKFHNGSPLTAEDVAFTFSPERLSGENALLPEGPAYFSVLSEVKVIDRTTLHFITKAPDPLLEQRLASWASWVVNKEDWLAKAEQDGGLPMFPVGTGPYMLEEYKADEKIVLSANDGSVKCRSRRPVSPVSCRASSTSSPMCRRTRSSRSIPMTISRPARWCSRTPTCWSTALQIR